jgi:hypothetical protein
VKGFINIHSNQSSSISTAKYVDALCCVSLEEEEEVGSLYQRYTAFVPQLNKLLPPSREINRPTRRLNVLGTASMTRF